MLRQHIHLRASTDRREDTQAKLNSCEPFLEACDDHLHFSDIQSPKSSRFILLYDPGAMTYRMHIKHSLCA